MSILGAIAGSVLPKLAGGLVGKLFGGKKSTTSRTNFKQLRDDATAAGFNPLTALRATGGGGNVTTTQPSLSTGEFIAEAVQRGTETWFNRDQIARDAEVEQIKVATMRAELEQLQNRNGAPSSQQSFGYSIPTAATVGQRDEYTAPALTPESETAWPSRRDGRPMLRPTIANARKIPLFTPDGQMRMVPLPVADRLNFKPWDYITAGDYAEMTGELRGEVESALVSDKIGQTIGIPLFGDPALTPPRRPRRANALRKPYGVSAYGS